MQQKLDDHFTTKPKDTKDKTKDTDTDESPQKKPKSNISHSNKAEAINGTENTSDNIWVQYVTRDACPFLKEEIEYAPDTIDDLLRNFADMLDAFYKAKINRYTGKEEYDFTTEEIVQAIRKTIKFNTNKELTLFVYDCQNTVVANTSNDTSHNGTFLQVCQKVSNRLLVSKGKPPSSGLIPRKRHLCHLKKIESRVQALQKANATYQDNVVYSLQEDGNREGKFEGTDKNAQFVLHDQRESPHWNASSFDTYLKEDLGDKPKQNQMNQNMDCFLHENFNAAWKLFNPSTLPFTDPYVPQEEWLKFFKTIMNLHTEEDKREAAQKA